MFTRPQSSPILCLAALIVVLVVQTVPLYAQPAATAWPMDGQNPQRSGKGLFPGPQNDDLVWVGGTRSIGGIAIGADAIYAREDLGLAAINFDGSLRWRFSASPQPQTCPAVGDDGTIYLAFYDGTFRAVNPAKPGATIDGRHNLQNAVVWSYPTGAIQSSGVIDPRDGSVVVGSLTGRLYKFSKEGVVRWNIPLKAGTESNAAIDVDGAIYIGCDDGNLYCISSEGTVNWKWAAGKKIAGGPAIGANHVVYFTTLDYRLFAIDPLAPAKNRKKWSVSLGKARTWDFCLSRPAVDNANGRVYCGGFDGLYAFAMSGALQWKLATPEEIWDQPAVGADGGVYAFCFDGKLYAVDSSGRLRWSFATVDNNVRCGPVIDEDGALYCGGMGLHALQDGAISRPTVFELSVNPDPVAVGQTVALWALQPTEGLSPIEQVDFYWDRNENGVIDGAGEEGGDVYLGRATDPNASGNYSVSVVAGDALPAGTHAVLVQATDSLGIGSNVARNRITVTTTP